MTLENMKTYFAPPSRKYDKAIWDEANLFISSQELTSVIDALPQLYVILNAERQIVYANKAMLDFSDMDSISEMLGIRPGELLKCKHASEMEAGCGTSISCSFCGAVNAILEAQELKRNISKECRICTVNDDDVVEYGDYTIRVNPIQYLNYEFYLLSIDDISSKKRMENLESIFYHDIKNLAGGMGGIIHLLQRRNDFETRKEYVCHLEDASSMLLTMIDSQLELLHAERGDFKVTFSPIESASFIDSMLNQMKNHPVSKHKQIRINKIHENFIFVTDYRLLSQVVVNMIKNAVEASDDDSNVMIEIKLENDQVVLTVHNDGYIPKEIQSRIFKYSFSTKGSSRGIGTYGMNLITNRYLNGNIHFETDINDGTDFILEIPFKGVESVDMTI